MNSYEAMFLLDAGKGNHEQAAEPIRRVLDRNGADVLTIKPWDERKLAYEISGRKRGLYMLTYFKMDPGNVAELEHDSQLSDEILRMLILRKDRITDEEVNAETPAMVEAVSTEPKEQDESEDEDSNRDESDDSQGSDETAEISEQKSEDAGSDSEESGEDQKETESGDEDKKDDHPQS